MKWKCKKWSPTKVPDADYLLWQFPLNSAFSKGKTEMSEFASLGKEFQVWKVGSKTEKNIHNRSIKQRILIATAYKPFLQIRQT